ncbi:hypothetical protein [Modestobacter sp. Leaf380]|uniref:hypothetical protein n=1 Tax=Modestobacter sp. Leaf380 TaxID=1736356 RepID=UPI0006F2621F|nr:hypothetical protein [Modestobacter sp. Leaf380]KQS73266.1 hypothetical protein ASG41_00805 [Modestobacter sp. Leaf380]
MAPTPSCPPELRGVVFRGSHAVRRGQLTTTHLRSRAFVRLFRDVRAGPDVVVDHRVRAVAAAQLLLPGAVVAGRSAAVLWGVPLAGLTDDVELVLPPGCTSGRVDGVRVRRERIAVEETVLRSGVAVTSLVRTALDLARARPVEEAVALVDRFLLAVPVGQAEVLAAARADPSRGARRREAVVRLADGLAESPQETVVRLLLQRAGLPAPIPQFRVLHEGREVARVDLGWPAHRVAVEYDGRWHGGTAQFARDRARLNRLTAAGWRVVFVTAEDLRDPASVVGRVRAELAR